MTAKIFALLALLVLSVSGTTAFFSPQCSLAPSNAIIPQFLPPVTALGYEHPVVRTYRLQLVLAASILRQPIAQLHQQSSAHLLVQAQLQLQLQLQQVLPALSQLAVANPAAYLQLAQLLSLNNPLVATNIAFLQQQQQLQQFLPALSQLAMANPAAYWQQQPLLPFNQLSLVNAPTFLQQQLLDLFTQLTLANVGAYQQQQQQQQLLPFNPLAVSNPLAAAFLPKQQLLSFNQMSLLNPTLSWQQPIVGGAIF